MNEDELFLSSHKLLISIHTMTGWILPEGEFLDALENNFQRKLSESYSNINMEEMEYAFRNRDAAVRDWGKALNFSLIDEVVLPYLEKRFELSKLEEQEHNKKLVMIEEKKEMGPMEMIEWINEWKQKEDIIVDLIPLSFYDFLTTTEQIYVNDEMKWDYWDKAIQAIKTELNMAISACKTTDALKAFTEFEKMYADKKYTAKMKDRVSNKAKKLIVFDYFRKK